jgi:hypothetical protein
VILGDIITSIKFSILSCDCRYISVNFLLFTSLIILKYSWCDVEETDEPCNLCTFSAFFTVLYEKLFVCSAFQNKANKLTLISDIGHLLHSYEALKVRRFGCDALFELSHKRPQMFVRHVSNYILEEHTLRRYFRENLEPNTYILFSPQSKIPRCRAKEKTGNIVLQHSSWS